jgi:hypothetical protein
MGNINRTRIKVTTTGSAGSATGEATSDPIRGTILALAVDYHASAPATTDLTISRASGIGSNIYAKTDSKDDVEVSPRLEVVDNTGTAITGTAGRMVLADDGIKVALAGCDALTDAVVVDVWWEGED